MARDAGGDPGRASTPKSWIAENEAGRPWFEAAPGERSQPLEEVGGRLRALIPFLDPVTITPEGSVRKATRPADAPIEAVP